MIEKEKQERLAETKGDKTIGRFLDFHGPVFWPATAIIVLFIAIAIVVGRPMEKVFSDIQDGVSDYAGWFFVLAVNVFLFFTVYLSLSRFGNIRLGGKNAEPEFSSMAWFAMLFSAGMGIGILFWSVAEPILHFQSPPIGAAGETRASAIEAMNFTFLHWGMHAWGIYALVGLSLAFFFYNRKLPLTIRSAFYPIFGNRIHGWAGNVIDVLAVVATLFGLATSLGLGATQINSGLSRLFGLEDSVVTQVILIIAITAIATTSVVLGIDKGVRMLSEWNIRIAAVFLIFMIALGPTLFIFDSLVQNTGYYLQNVLSLGFWTESYQQTDWQNNWTVFYWAWWISWSPFVGMFIARISRGRTIREFVLGVLIVPTALTFLWLTAFGGSAILLELNGSDTISDAVSENVATALYVLLEQYPFSFVTCLVGVFLIASFFVTSSDSGSLVIDSISSGGKINTPVAQRIFWASIEGGVAAVLLIGGGLKALQTVAIITGLPFALALLVMCYSLYRGLKMEASQEEELQKEKDKRSYEKTLSELATRYQKKKTETKE